jgi:L-ascorbate metabolism protein UlaG (beta-lactamase superfamily)
VRIAVLPATHDGRRGPHSRLRAPAVGFRVDGSGRSFWFPGDTELREDMSDVGSVDLALVPIGGWGPTLEDGHMDPVDGAEAVRRVGATTAVPVHWGTFWPIGLRHLARANHHRLFVTPGQRFVDALGPEDATVLLLEPGDRAALDGRGFTRMG